MARAGLAASDAGGTPRVSAGAGGSSSAGRRGEGNRIGRRRACGSAGGGGNCRRGGGRRRGGDCRPGDRSGPALLGEHLLRRNAAEAGIGGAEEPAEPAAIGSAGLPETRPRQYAGQFAPAIEDRPARVALPRRGVEFDEFHGPILLGSKILRAAAGHRPIVAVAAIAGQHQDFVRPRRLGRDRNWLAGGR